jgi:iron(III) transport system substrate-binding protein
MLVYGLAIAPAAAQSTDNKLVIYSGRSEGLIAPILKQFSEETGIPVEVRYGGTAEMASTILEEGNNSPADVFIAQDAGALGALAAAGRLSKLPSDILERVAPKFQSGEELWVGVSGRARVLVYNTKLITADKLPASILDLTKPEWKDKVGWSPANGSFQANVTAMRIQLGEATTKKWLQDMIGNGVAAFENNDAIVQAVINGEIPVGLVNHYYVFEFKAQLPDAPVAVHNFKDGDSGALINVAGAGVLNTSKRAGLAQRLLLYLLGKKAQTYFAEKTGEYPLIEGVAADKSVKPLDQIKGPEVDLSKLSDLQGTLALLRDTGALP